MAVEILASNDLCARQEPSEQLRTSINLLACFEFSRSTCRAMPAGGLDVTLKVAVTALAPARVKYGFTPLIAGVLSSHSILLENAPLITFFTFSPPQALEQPDHFHAGGIEKKGRWDVAKV